MRVNERSRSPLTTVAGRTRRLLTPLLFTVIAAVTANEAPAQSVPAMKAGVSASDVEVMQSQLGSGSSSSRVQLLTLTLHTTNPEDVEFSVTAECAAAWSGSIDILGSVDTKASVKIWTEVDGVPVPVSPAAGDDGKVTFCSRSTQLDASIPGGFFDLYEKTKAANAFNWVLGNVGSGTHTIVVYGQLDVYVNGIGSAEAGVGRRTLTAEPVHLTNDATW